MGKTSNSNGGRGRTDNSSDLSDQGDTVGGPPSRLALIKRICERLFTPDLDELDLDSWGLDDD